MIINSLETVILYGFNEMNFYSIYIFIKAIVYFYGQLVTNKRTKFCKKKIKQK